MENMVNEEVMEVTEEVATSNSGKVFGTIAKIGLVAVAGGFIYKKLLKPVFAKFKAKKEERDKADFEKSLDETLAKIEQDEKELG